MRSDIIEIAVRVEHETEKAWLVDDGTQKVWVPKSRVEISDGKSGGVVLMIPEPLAIEKGLV